MGSGMQGKEAGQSLWPEHLEGWRPSKEGWFWRLDPGVTFGLIDIQVEVSE